MIGITSEGDFKNTEKFLKKVKEGRYMDVLDKYGNVGVSALAQATPKRTGKTAASWGYEIQKERGGYVIYWTNNNNNKDFYVAVALQYGHGTRNGGYVMGRDYINPAMRPVFDKIAEDAWKEVTSA